MRFAPKDFLKDPAVINPKGTIRFAPAVESSWLTCRGHASGPARSYLCSLQEANMICIVGNDSGKGVTWWVVPITLAMAPALAWAVIYLEQTGRIKLN